MEKLYGAKVCRPKCKAKDKRVVKGGRGVFHTSASNAIPLL